MTTKNKYFGIDVKLDTAAAQAAARRMCEHQNLRVVFDLSPQDAPYTDGKTVHIESPHEYQTKAALNAWWAKLVHETRHNTTRGKQCFDVARKEKIDTKSLHGFMYNIFEDCVIDNLGRGKYIGQDEASGWFHSFMFDNHTLKPKALKEMWHNAEAPATGVQVATAFLLDGLVRQEYMPEMIGKVNQFLDSDPNINPAIIEAFEKMQDGDWQERLTDLALSVDDPDSKSADVWQFTQDFLGEVFDQPPYEPPPSAGQGEGEEGEGEGEGTDAAEGDGDGDEKGKHTDLAEKQYAKMLFEEMERDDHQDIDMRKNRTIRGVDMDLTYAEGSGHYQPLPPSRRILVDYEQKKFVTEAGRHTSMLVNADFEKYANSHWKADYIDLSQTGDSLANEVKRYIQSETRKKQTRNKKKGMLDKKKLFKLGVPDAGKDWQERVFWTLENNFTVDNTVVSLLCDISGSMSGDKIEHAIKSMDLLGDVCKALKIKYEMAAFTTISGGAAVHFLYKPFNVNVPRSKIAERMVNNTGCMSANADGENVKIAYTRLREQEAKRRVLIVLSDGYPAFRGGDIEWYTKTVARQIQQEGLVEIHGIGIMSDAVRSFYDSYSVLNKAEELEECLLTVLKNKVLRFT